MAAMAGCRLAYLHFDLLAAGTHACWRRPAADRVRARGLRQVSGELVRHFNRWVFHRLPAMQQPGVNGTSSSPGDESGAGPDAAGRWKCLRDARASYRRLRCEGASRAASCCGWEWTRRPQGCPPAEEAKRRQPGTHGREPRRGSRRRTGHSGVRGHQGWLPSSPHRHACPYTAGHSRGRDASDRVLRRAHPPPSARAHRARCRTAASSWQRIPGAGPPARAARTTAAEGATCGRILKRVPATGGLRPTHAHV